MLRALRTLDPSITLGWVQDVDRASRPDEEIIRARNATLRARPDDVKALLRAAVPRAVAPRTAGARGRSVRRFRAAPADDPYGF